MQHYVSVHKEQEKVKINEHVQVLDRVCHFLFFAEMQYEINECRGGG